MCDLTFIARVSDGLIFTETWDGGKEGQAMAKYKQQAKQLLRHMNSFPPQCSIDTGAYVFHYITDGGIVYMTLCDQRYPKKLAFSFLEEIRQAFVEELAREFGTTDSLDYRQHIEAITKPYHFISFDRQITKRRNDYRDPTSTRALNRLNDSLTEVNSIMQKNIDDILTRGEKLEDVGRRANDLKDASKSFSKKARMINLQAMFRKHATMAIFLVFFLFIIWWKAC
ncbi:Vesicle-trafficking protein S22a [Perkinsus olseni]|uniref:Vesicle-trafficking protein S22a n=1 Tax=Perkinsus olseni TaxID=32597 RepID=A0A7J6PNM3_PEROL|nr:Vesicle-trafficking protein S22a [Perkinsus olseni]